MSTSKASIKKTVFTSNSFIGLLHTLNSRHTIAVTDLNHCLFHQVSSV